MCLRRSLSLFSAFAFYYSFITSLLQIHVTQGDLICPVCSHAYPIQAGIANMRLDESEL